MQIPHTIERTVNPLVYKVSLTFEPALVPKTMMLVWNLFQKYASANESIMQGRPSMDGRRLTVDVGIRRRLGEAKNKHPIDLERKRNVYKRRP